MRTKIKNIEKTDNSSNPEITEVNIKLSLTIEQWSQLDLFMIKLKTKGMRLLLKRPNISLANIMFILVEIMLSDKELSNRVEERLLEKLKTK